MTENTMVVDYDPFSMESRVSIFTSTYQEQERVDSVVEELAKKLIDLAYRYGTYNVKIRAPFAIISEIKRVVEYNEKNLYSNNKINVEGI